MISVEKMVKIRVVAPKSKSYAVIDTLYKLHNLHLKKYKELKNTEQGAPLEQAEKLSAALIKIRSLLSTFNLHPLEDIAPVAFSHDTFSKKLEDIYSKTSTIQKDTKEKERLLSRLQKKLAIIQGLGKLGIDIKKLDQLSLTKLHIGVIKADADLSGLGKKGYKVVSLNGDRLIAIVSQAQDKMDETLEGIGFSPIKIANFLDLSEQSLVAEVGKIKKQLMQLDKSLLEIKIANKAFLVKHEKIVQEEIRKAELPLDFSTTAQSIIMTGFVPKKELSSIKTGLEATTNGAVDVEELEVDLHHEDVPVKFNNPNPVRNFEVLMRLYELPKYIELDPSILLFITFPFFFGYMLGDVGYGIATFLIFYFVKKKFPTTRQFMNVLMIASLVTIAFGGIYGEYLGFEYVSEETGEKWCDAGICFHKELLHSHGHEEIVYSFPRLIHRGHDAVNIGGMSILSVLFFGILIGAVHVNIGLLVGFYNKLRAHGLKHAVLEKISWFVLQAGVVLLVMSFAGIGRVRLWVGIAVFLLACIMLFIGEGAKGIIEIPAIFSNMLSYVRLGAVGLASLGLAVVVNEQLALPMMAKGGVWIVLAILVMIIGHLINIALGVLGPFLHGIRLHYVAFFTKFFEGGGEEYEPFGFKHTEV